jgi:hypothetical protein
MKADLSPFQPTGTNTSACKNPFIPHLLAGRRYEVHL